MTTVIPMEIRELSGETLRLTYTAPDDIQMPQDLARQALEMIFSAFEGLCEFLSVELALACCDTATGYPLSEPMPPQPFWLLRLRALPPGVGVRPTWSEVQIAETDTLGSASVLTWLEERLAQPCPPGSTTALSWAELRFGTTSVRLPIDPSTLIDGRVRVRQGAGTLEYPVECRGKMLWVAGPRSPQTLTAPIELRLTNEAGFFTLDITLYWSVWNDQGNQGRQLLEQTLDRLRAAGWVDG